MDIIGISIKVLEFARDNNVNDSYIIIDNYYISFDIMRNTIYIDYYNSKYAQKNDILTKYGEYKIRKIL